MIHGFRFIVSFLLFFNTLSIFVFTANLNAQEIFVINPYSNYEEGSIKIPKSRIIANPIFLPSQLPQKNESLYLNPEIAKKTSPNEFDYSQSKNLRTIRILPNKGYSKNKNAKDFLRKPSSKGYVDVGNSKTKLTPVAMKDLALGYDAMYPEAVKKKKSSSRFKPINIDHLSARNNSKPSNKTLAKKSVENKKTKKKKKVAKSIKKLKPKKKERALASIKSLFSSEKDTLAKNVPALKPKKRKKFAIKTNTASAREIPKSYKKSKSKTKKPTVKMSLFFDENSDVVNIEGFNKLGKFSSKYKKKINNTPYSYIYLTGYADGTDERGSVSRKLSLDRAINTRTVLERYGIAKNRIKIKALGNKTYDSSLPDRVDLAISVD